MFGFIFGLEQIFAGCAIFGGALFVVRLLLQLAGGDHGDGDVGDLDVGGGDVDMDAGSVDVSEVHGGNVHGHGDSGFKILSLQGITSFFLMFGLVGLALLKEGHLNQALAALGALAAGYNVLVDSCDGDARSAATLLMIEKIEEVVRLQVEAIKNLKIDKVTVWDSGGANGNGSSTADFASSLIKSLPPLHDVAEMAGIDLPGYLGNLRAEESKSFTSDSTQ